MKYLVTGCYGFVGSYLARHLVGVEPTAEIVGLDRAPAKEGFPVQTRSHQIDLLDLGAVQEVLAKEQPDYLVHLASFSSVGFSWKNPVESFSNNTNIFLNVLEGVRRHCPHARILSIGSSEEYGVVTTQDLPLVETTALRPMSPYAVARVAQEHLGKVYVDGFGLDIVATRSFNHVGAGQLDQFVVSAIGKKFAEAAKGKRQSISVGTTKVIRDFLDVRDVVRAYYLLLKHGTRGSTYNICSGRGTSVAEIIALFSKISGVNPPVESDSELMRPVENEIVIGSHERLTREVGWTPIHPLEESLTNIYDYWLARV